MGATRSAEYWLREIYDELAAGLGISTISAALSAGENHLGSVGGAVDVVSASFTRPNNATPYTALDAVSDNTATPTVPTFTDLARVAAVTPYAGYVHMDSIGGFGAYLFSGTAVQLTALNALPQVVGIVAVTEAGDVKWAELDGTIAAGVRTKLNTWLTARGYPTIPAGWTYRRVIEAVYKRLNAKFDLAGFDVKE